MDAASFPPPDLPDLPDWSASGGPDTFTLRAWLGVEQAAETVGGLDDAVAFMQDRVTAVLGRHVLSRSSRFVDERGLGDDATGRLLADDALLAQLLAFLLADDEAPDPPDGGYSWTAYPPGHAAQRFRRSVRRGRRQRALRALLLPRSGRVAGSRARARLDHGD